MNAAHSEQEDDGVLGRSGNEPERRGEVEGCGDVGRCRKKAKGVEAAQEMSRDRAAWTKRKEESGGRGGGEWKIEGEKSMIMHKIRIKGHSSIRDINLENE